MYILFCVLNAVWLLVFAGFSLFTSAGASWLTSAGFLALYVLLMFFYAVFGAKAENDSAFKKWIYIAAIVVIGLIFRVIALQIFETEQVQDFGRAHEAFLFLNNDTWTDGNYYQLYYARFPAWFPFFMVTRFVYNIFGIGARYIIFLNYILYALSAAVLYASVKRIFSFATAFCATAVFVFNPNLIVWSAITSPDYIFVFLFICMFYFISRHYSEEKDYRFLAFAAVFAALTDFFKPVGMVFLIAYFCVEIFLLLQKFSIKNNYKKWAVFLFTFLAVYFAGHAIVRAEIKRTFDTETVSSTGMYMAFAWSADENGNYTLAPVFDKFDELMEAHENNQEIVMGDMSAYARELFNASRHRIPSILWQKAKITFGDEGVLGWVIHTNDAEYSASTHRVLGHTLWVGFTAHIFVLMFFAAAGTLFAVSEKKHRAALIFLLTTAIGYTLVLLFGVVQARYRILLYPQFSILAAYGLVSIVNVFSNKKLYNFLKYHGRKIVLPVNEMKTEISRLITQNNITHIVDFGAGTLFWSEYFAEELSLTVSAVDNAYISVVPKNENPKISLYTNIIEALQINTEEKNAIFICDVIHHLQPEFWLEILPKISILFDVIIIKDIDSARKFGNFCSALHDRVINGTNFENVYPREIEKILSLAGFNAQITSVPKLWYPHFLLIAQK